MRELIRVLIILALIPESVLPEVQEKNYYYVCSYAEPRWGTNILFSKIDLDEKRVVFSKEIPITGQIFLYSPVSIKHQGKDYLFLATIYGVSGHNTPAGRAVGFYALIDTAGQILQIDSLRDTQFLAAIDTIESAVNYIDSLGSDKIAKLSIDDNFKVVFTEIWEAIYPEQEPVEIGGLKYFNRIDSCNDSLFWHVDNGRISLLVLDKIAYRLLNKLDITAGLKYSYLFALSPDKSQIYTFYINCQCKFSYDASYVGDLDFHAPGFLKIYSSPDLSLIDSVEIADPCADSICIGSGRGPCAKVGDYRVHYFMDEWSIGNFLPAHLFIFDTRTNEATWLRVGWR